MHLVRKFLSICICYSWRYEWVCHRDHYSFRTEEKCIRPRISKSFELINTSLELIVERRGQTILHRRCHNNYPYTECSTNKKNTILYHDLVEDDFRLICNVITIRSHGVLWWSMGQYPSYNSNLSFTNCVELKEICFHEMFFVHMKKVQ